MDFDQFWQRLQSNLHAGDMVRNWTAAKGYFGEDFKVLSVTADKVSVKPLTAETEPAASIEDFRVICRRRDEYLAGSFPRKGFTSDTWVSKYTISIIHHLSGESDGKKLD